MPERRAVATASVDVRDGIVTVELVGAPGAGKTTFVPVVMEACRAAGLRPYGVIDAARPFAARTAMGKLAVRLVPATRRRSALWAVYLVLSTASTLRVALRRPRLAWYVASTQLSRPAAAEVGQRRVVRWYLRLVGSERFLRSHARRGEALVIDEGFLHRAVQLHASALEAPERRQIASYVRAIPRPDLVVHVRAPSEVCERRVRSRGVWTRFDGRDPTELSRFLANAHRAVELAVEAARSQGWVVIEVENVEDAAAAGAELYAAITTFLTDRSEGQRAGRP